MSMTTPSAFRDLSMGCDLLLQVWEDQGRGSDGAHALPCPTARVPACRKLRVLGVDVQECMGRTVCIARVPGRTCRVGEGGARSLAGPLSIPHSAHVGPLVTPVSGPWPHIC